MTKAPKVKASAEADSPEETKAGADAALSKSQADIAEAQDGPQSETGGADKVLGTDVGAAQKSEPALEVTGPEAGRWRMGRHFTKAAVIIALVDLTEGQVAALKADPALTVREIA